MAFDNFDNFLRWFQSESADGLQEKVSKILKSLTEKGEETCSQGSAESQGQDTGIVARATALIKSFDLGIFSPRSMEVKPSVKGSKRSELKSELEGARLKSWAGVIDKFCERAAAAVG